MSSQHEANILGGCTLHPRKGTLKNGIFITIKEVSTQSSREVKNCQPKPAGKLNPIS